MEKDKKSITINKKTMSKLHVISICIATIFKSNNR